MATDENINEEETTTEYPIVSEPIAVYVRKKTERVEIGHAIVTRHENRTEVQMVIDSEEGNEFGSFLVTGVMNGITLGGLLNPTLAAKLGMGNA